MRSVLIHFTFHLWLSMLIKILLNDAFLKGTAEINEFSFAFPLDAFQLVAHTPRWTLLPFFSLNALTNGSRLLWKNAHGCPPTKGVDTGPSCKELGFENTIVSHVIYMCIDWFSIGISYESERPIPGLRVQWAIFSPKTNSYGNLGPSFQVSLLLRVYEPLPPFEFLIHLLIGWK